MFTSIHRAMGEAPGPLTWQMIEQLVEQRTEEAADLDFKQILPINKGEWREETAKDFAAMANSGGGVVLYGIAEERGRGTAKEIEPLEVKESDVRSLTQVAYSLVHPPLMDVRPVKVVDPQRPERGVLAMVVLPSAEVPHMYWKKEAFLAPVRHGSDTRWMDERQIEQAYRARFEGHRKRKTDLTDFYDETMEFTLPRPKACLVAVATPAGPGGMENYPAAAEDAERIFMAALPKMKDFIRSDSSNFNGLSCSPLVGLRRWRWLPPGRSGQAQHLLELHRDGSAALVVDIEGEYIQKGIDVDIDTVRAFEPTTTTLAIEFALAGFAAFLSAMAPSLRSDGGFETRVGLTWNKGPDGSQALNMYQSYGRMRHSLHPELVRRFTPVEGLLRTRTSAELRADVHELCTDLLNQAGLKEIVYLKEE